MLQIEVIRKTWNAQDRKSFSSNSKQKFSIEYYSLALHLPFLLAGELPNLENTN
jgi:hypothetical protein